MHFNEESLESTIKYESQTCCDNNRSKPQVEAGVAEDVISHTGAADEDRADDVSAHEQSEEPCGLELLDVCSLEDEIECLRVARIALMECYNILHLLGPWCCGRVAEILAKQVHSRVNTYYMYSFLNGEQYCTCACLRA